MALQYNLISDIKDFYQKYYIFISNVSFKAFA